MKAKEIAEECRRYYFGYPTDDSDRGYFVFSPYEYKVFCEALCLEQRQICAESVTGTAVLSRQEIVNAETPEL